MKKQKHSTPLLAAITLSMACASLLSFITTHTVRWSQPAVSILIQNLAHHDYPWNSGNLTLASGNSSIPSATQPDTEELPVPSDGAETETETIQSETPSASAPEDSLPPDTPLTENDTPQTEHVQYEFTSVTREYFDDALFIGDSRVIGVELYSGWDNFTYYAENGMTIYNMFQCEAEEEEGQSLTIEEALQKRSFGKIYLEIGINEMGTGNVDSFMKAYEEAVCRLRELQPDAIIYVCGIMYVKQSKSESDPIFNNPNIQERNDRIAELADSQNIFYLDINELVTDDTGNLNPDYTWDEVHLLGKYDSLWLDYFCSHGIVKN